MSSRFSYGFWRRKIGQYNKFEKIVNDAYLEILNRSADYDSIEHYGILLREKKIDFNSIKKILEDSPEGKNTVKRDRIVNDAYLEILNRSPNIEDILFFGILLREKKIDFAGIKKILKTEMDYNISENSKKIINEMYMNIFSTTLDYTGLNHYSAMLETKLITNDEIHEFFNKIKSGSNNSEFKTLDELTTESKKIVNSLYLKCLKRPADVEGLRHFATLLENKKISAAFIKKTLLDSDESKAINNYTHYSNKYWNDLPCVIKYINFLTTGDQDKSWIDDLKVQFKKFLPFDKVLIVGCGNGWLERELADTNIGKNFDAFDISEEYIQEAKNKKGDRSIKYFISDINNLDNLETEKYDAVFNYAIIHHVTDLDNAVNKIYQSMKTNALIFNIEYVGPDRNQYSEQHLSEMVKVLKKIPKKFRTTHPLKPRIENFRVDPSEAIHSSLVKSTLNKFFDIIHEKNLNGGIAYPLLWNFIEKFENEKDPESSDCLDFLLREDSQQSDNGKVPIFYWYSVGKKAQSN